MTLVGVREYRIVSSLVATGWLPRSIVVTYYTISEACTLTYQKINGQNSHALIMADPTLADVATETLTPLL